MKRVAVGVELRRQPAGADRDGAVDLGLAAEFGPVEDDRHVRVRLDVPGLAGPESRGEDEGVGIDPLQAHRPR